MAPHSSTLAWKVPWTEEPDRLKSMLRFRHNWATSLSLFTFMHWRRKWQPTPAFLRGESQDGGAWWAAVYGVAQSWTWLKWLSSSSIPTKLEAGRGEGNPPGDADADSNLRITGGSVVESTWQCRWRGFNTWKGEIPWRKKWQPTLAWRIPWTEEPGGLKSVHASC